MNLFYVRRKPFWGKDSQLRLGPQKVDTQRHPQVDGAARITVAPLPLHGTPTCAHTTHLPHYWVVGFPRGSCI